MNERSAPAPHYERPTAQRSVSGAEPHPIPFTDLQAVEAASAMRTYARFPVEFVRGAGARLWDAEGNEYLDLLCGISVTNVGHCHPLVVEAVRAQAGRLLHAGNLYYT
ncbi:MAG: aminotransferase class III-fold pyridoxal phosphate-dependent enzyme, partial [Solirubrobacteraceae bacterium]